jgi:hypothetical protein
MTEHIADSLPEPARSRASWTDDRAAFVCGITGVVSSTGVALILSMAASISLRVLILAAVPGAVAVAAVATGSPRSAGRLLGWISIALVLVGLALGLIDHAITDTATSD